jgi:hypothetical protein
VLGEDPHLVFLIFSILHLYHGDVAHRAIARLGRRITALRTLVHSFLKGDLLEAYCSLVVETFQSVKIITRAPIRILFHDGKLRAE